MTVFFCSLAFSLRP